MVVIAPQGAKRSEREGQAIKGPGIRLDLDVRRVWRCPKCQRVLKTAGHITSRRCPIDGAFMQLDDSAQRASRRFSFPPINIEEDEEDRVLVEQPSSQPTTDDDDDDRPRKQSRKEKRRRRRRKPNGPASEHETEPLEESSETETDEPIESGPTSTGEPEPDTGDQTSPAT